MTKLKYLIAVLILAVSAFATNKTVKAGGGGDFTTIQACATAMLAGDTCTVFVGTYNETVTVTAGTAGNYKTITVNGSDVVTVKGFVINSHTKLIGNCPTPSLGSAPAVGSCGFSITNPSSPSSAACVRWNSGITDFYITNNVISQCGSGFQIGSSFTLLSDHGFIQNNTLSYACVSSASPVNECNSIMPFGDHFLIEGNDLSHYTLSIDFGTTRSVYRNNTFHDQFETEAGGNHHTDAFFSEPGAGVAYTVEYNLFEGNYQYNAQGANSKTDLFQNDSGTTCPNCFNAIWRFNTVSRIGSGVASNYFWPHIMAYNNTIVDALSDGTANNGTADYAQFSTNGSYINQLYYFTFASGVNWNVYQCGSGCNFGHSLYWCTGTCTSVWGNTPAVPFLSDPGNVHADPKFVTYVSAGNVANNYHLQATSPAIAAGTNLTTTVGSGSSSTALILADASYLSDGFGLTGVQPDCIRIGAVTTACISSINYATNAVTLAAPATWSAGALVYLYKNSSGTVVLNPGNPDMGAYPASTGSPAVSLAPTALHFGNTTVLTDAPQQSFVLTNSGSATLNITSIVCNSGCGVFPSVVFRITSNGCGSTLGAGLSCTVQATFHPFVVGLQSATIAVTSDAASSPDTIALDGTGVAAAPAVSLVYTGMPVALAFGSVPINTTSAGQGIVLTNSGTATLNITSILPGGANPGQYTVLSNTCGSTLSASFSCTVTVAFAPTSVGSKPASIIFTTDASTSPDTVVLSGTGSTSSPAAVCAACFAQLKVPTIFTCKNVVSGVSGLNFNNCNCTCK